VCRSSYSKDEYIAAIEQQANNWRDLATEMSSRCEAVKSELDKAFKKSALEVDRHQRTVSEVKQLLSSAHAPAACFQRSAAEPESELTSKQSLPKESEQAQDLLSSKLVSQVHIVLACLMCTQSDFCHLLSSFSVSSMPACLSFAPLQSIVAPCIAWLVAHQFQHQAGLIIVIACSIMSQTFDALLALCCGMLICWCDAGRR